MNKHDGQGLSPRYVAFRVGDGEKTLSECDALPGQRRARKKSRMVREEGLEPSRLAAPDPKSENRRFSKPRAKAQISRQSLKK